MGGKEEEGEEETTQPDVAATNTGTTTTTSAITTDNNDPTVVVAAVVSKEDDNVDAQTDDDDVESIDFLHDDENQMTWTRRIGLYMSRKYKWYNPYLGKEDDDDEQENDNNAAEGGAGEEGGDDDDNDAATKEKPQETTTTTTTSRGQQQVLQQQTMVEENGDNEDPLANAIDAYPFTSSSPEKPSIEKAWAYYEHDTLPRFVWEKNMARSIPGANASHVDKIRSMFHKADQQLDRAEPGENKIPTRLYHPIFTPHKQLGDWGLGIGLYFTTLRGLAILTLLAGLLNVTNMMFYASDDYSTGQDGSISGLVRASAVCTQTQWVPCDDCTEDVVGEDRYAQGIDDNGMILSFALRNECDGANIARVTMNFVTLIAIFIGILVMNRYVRGLEVAFDEDEQTAQDYSILISNPPSDATNPDEWKQFFYNKFNGAHVTTCTIAVDNDLLVRTLVERREILRKIETKLDPGTSLDTLSLAKIAAKEESGRKALGRFMASLAPGIPELFGKVTMLNAKVQGLAQQTYPATKVFISFETEAAQRHVLSALSVGSYYVSRNKKSILKDPGHLFRGEYVLDVKEPDEPSTIRWQDLNEKFNEKMKQQALTTLTTIAAIILITYLIDVLNRDILSPSGTSLVITVLNILFPMFAKKLTALEAHSSESGKQRSLYFKIAFFRWVNTAVVIAIVRDFTTTLEEDTGLINQVHSLFFAEIVTVNITKLADFGGHFKRHFSAPRAKTQDAMNIAMQGQEVELADLYTNMTKVLFLALWYSSIYPAGLIMCAIALTATYFCDRFTLMRTWKRASKMGPTVSQFSRRYFFPLAIAAMAIMSSYYWSGFPFDNLCVNDQPVDQRYIGTWSFTPTNDDDNDDTADTEKIQYGIVKEGDPSYRQCLQDFLRYPNGERSFPFVPSNQINGEEWMTNEQEKMTRFYGWSALVVVLIVACKFIYLWIKDARGLFLSPYKPRGEDQGINFSNVPSMSSYVPEVRSTAYSYPLVACNMDGIDLELFDWTDPDRPHSFYDLTKDAKVLCRRTNFSTAGVFSRLAHYPPSSDTTKKEDE